jgi:hypothetical protein
VFHSGNVPPKKKERESRMIKSVEVIRDQFDIRRSVKNVLRDSSRRSNLQIAKRALRRFVRGRGGDTHFKK